MLKVNCGMSSGKKCWKILTLHSLLFKTLHLQIWPLIFCLVKYQILKK